MKNDIASLQIHAALLAQFRCLRDVTVDFGRLLSLSVPVLPLHHMCTMTSYLLNFNAALLAHLSHVSCMLSKLWWVAFSVVTIFLTNGVILPIGCALCIPLHQRLCLCSSNTKVKEHPQAPKMFKCCAVQQLLICRLIKAICSASKGWRQWKPYNVSLYASTYFLILIDSDWTLVGELYNNQSQNQQSAFMIQRRQAPQASFNICSGSIIAG